MKIISFKITNFRRLFDAQIDIANEKTIFVGANNSGKTSASHALKCFLSKDGRKQIKMNDITLINHKKINQIGEKWVKYDKKEISDEDIQKSYQEFISYFPSLDILIDVPKNEIHHVIKIIPSLDWQAGILGVRLCYEADSIEELRKVFVEKRLNAIDAQDKKVTLWPSNLVDFLSNELNSFFTINTYLLDIDNESKEVRKKSDFIVQGFNIHDLIKFDFIPAQREVSDDSDKLNDIEKPAAQIRQYYDTIINPEKSPTDDRDFDAITAIQDSQNNFNKMLETKLESLFEEIKSLGYPSIADPDIEIKTKIGILSSFINHSSALNYKINDLSLPENYLGLGYQNIIAMTVKLIKQRDEWLGIGKSKEQKEHIKRLHFVIIEEPEAHLHAQAQLVFINNSYNLLTRYKNTEDSVIKERYKHIDKSLCTQMLVTTHSSHIVHEVDFACLRYFDRFTSNNASEIPLTQVKNLSNYFNSQDAGKRFAARYLKLHHCDIFFADALIMLEGKAEKLLIPQFIKDRFKELYRRYISYIEIEGDYVHIFRPLIEILGIDTLIITDLDSADQNGNKQLPQKTKEQISSNPVINAWLFDDNEKKKTIDILINLKEEERIKKLSSTSSEVYFAFQQEIDVDFSRLDGGFNKKFIGQTIPRTFEDALLINNLEFIAQLPKKMDTLPTQEKSQLKKVVKDCNDFNNLTTLMKAFYTRLNPNDKLIEGLSKITKAELALELLFICDTNYTLNPPKYIELGLNWLNNRLKKKETKTQEQANE
ncbi:AAA family ATPase [Snodgrassella sp. M0351]|uniref:AAA family ATPase n=1 Tax=Snodgrassella sp. M0351 TaxID=2751012 RepID=UPI0018DBFDC8|nr:AAA family ATPase [Snodgrassella sp. M0351]MBI0165091.1 AAA family ATPase [Snodgrassella sp. M0351]